MSEDWFVRVMGKEYGPVELDELREWKAEGRLIADNEVRRASESDWVRAGEVTELFPAPPPLPTEAEILFRRRTLPEIVRHAFAVYRIGWPVFIGLALLVAVPSFVLKVSLAYVRVRPETGFGDTPTAAIVLSLLMIPLVLAAWFAFIGGLQFAATDIVAGRVPQFRGALERVRSIWPRIAKLGFIVYGSYIFWTLLPLMAILIIAGGRASVGAMLIALIALGFQVFMVVRLFINFLFWQQACTIGGLDVVESLRESSELARSGEHAPRLERPLYRGAIIAAVWLLVLLACNTAVEVPFFAARLQGVSSIEQVQNVTEGLMNSPAPDGLTLAAYGLSSLVHLLLRPLLGIAFVLLYLDAKARQR